VDPEKVALLLVGFGLVDLFIGFVLVIPKFRDAQVRSLMRLAFLGSFLLLNGVALAIAKGWIVAG
jgi:hypothetical protein